VNLRYVRNVGTFAMAGRARLHDAAFERAIVELDHREVSAARVVPAIVAVRWRAAEIAPLTWGPGPVLRDVQPQLASADFASVELLDGLGGMLFSREPDECEPSGTSGVAILGNVNVNDLPDLPEELT